MSQLAIRSSSELPPGTVVTGTFRRLSDGAYMMVVEISPLNPVIERLNQRLHSVYNVGQLQANSIDLHG